MPSRLFRRAQMALRSVLRRRTVERELDDELRFHFDEMQAVEAARGRAAADARREARRRFGGMTQVKEGCRDMRMLRPIEHFVQDLRFGARLLARSPVFTLVAVLSLALGIGANTAIFSLLNAIVLRPLPVSQSEQLYIARTLSRGEISQRFSYPMIVSARAELAGRAEVCAQSSIQPMQIGTAGAAGSAIPESAQVQLLSGDCFTTLRQQAQIGRLLGPADNVTIGQHPVAVISDSYWTRRFGRSPSALGSDLIVNGTALTVVGVTTPGFFGTTLAQRNPDIWAPVVMQHELRYAGNVSNSNGDTRKPWAPQREVSWLTVVLRVPGGDVPAVTEALNLVAQREFALIEGYTKEPEFRERLQQVRVALVPGSRGFSRMRDEIAAPLGILLGMVGLVLVIACANIASLLLARGSHREREIAVRLTIGAGRARLFRQLLTESLLLALIGGALGLLAANWVSAALMRFAAQGQTPGVDVSPDRHVLAFAFGVSVFTGILFGLLPAIRGTRVALSETLNSHARSLVGAGTPGRSSAGRLLTAGQMAFSVLLLVLAALFARSLQALGRVDAGFDREHLLVARIDPQSAGFERGELPALYQRLLATASAVPGVASASLSANGPFSGSRSTSSFEAQGYSRGRDEQLRTQEETVTPDYFRTVGLNITRGRGFTAEDAATARNVTVINETMARRYFQGQEAIGKRWAYGTDFGPDSFEIVGVVQDAHYNDLTAATPNMAYRPAAQNVDYLASLEIRAAGDPAALVPTLRKVLRESEPRLSIASIEPLDARIVRSMGQGRLLTWLTLAFGMVALSLACLGLYGTISYAVTRRTAELGIRMALGADRASVRWMIMREALAVVLAGVVVGLPLALLSARGLRTILYGVSIFDALAYATALAALLLVAAAAAYLPARRASRLDPMLALRAD